jgi:hypothetical protein
MARYVDADDKPMIRHCVNCKYYSPLYRINGYECSVKYQYVYHFRLKALFCRFFKKEAGGTDGQTN